MRVWRVQYSAKKDISSEYRVAKIALVPALDIQAAIAAVVRPSEDCKAWMAIDLGELLPDPALQARVADLEVANAPLYSDRIANLESALASERQRAEDLAEQLEASRIEARHAHDATATHRQRADAAEADKRERVTISDEDLDRIVVKRAESIPVPADQVSFVVINTLYQGMRDLRDRYEGLGKYAPQQPASGPVHGFCADGGIDMRKR